MQLVSSNTYVLYFSVNCSRIPSDLGCGVVILWKTMCILRNGKQGVDLEK